MKRVLFLFAIAAAAGFMANAQNAKTGQSSAQMTIRIENDTKALVYYTLVDAGSADLKTMSSNADTIVSYLKDHAANLLYLGPNASNQNLAAGDKEALLVGLSVESGSVVYPIWYLRIPQKNLRAVDAWYSVSQAKKSAMGQGAASIGAFDIEFPVSSLRIDGGFVDWLNVKDALTFAAKFLPPASQNSGSGTKPVNAADAMFWKRGGTDLEHFKLVKNGAELDLMFSSFSAIAPGLSYIVKFYAPDAKTINSYTLELPINSKGGPVVLWTQGAAQAKVVGDLAAGDFYTEARVFVSNLPQDLQVLLSNAAIELSSSYYSGGVREQFYMGRLDLSNVVNLQ